MSDSVVTIAPTSGDTARKPGETIELTASWSLPSAPSSVVVRLIWFAEGVEVSESAVIASRTLPEAVRGEHKMTFTLPKAPYSFVGQAVKLRWAVELIAGDAGAARWEFDLSPSGQAIALGTVAPLDPQTSAPEAVLEAIDQDGGVLAAIAMQIAKRISADPATLTRVARRIGSAVAVIAFLLYAYSILRPPALEPSDPPVAQIERAPVLPAGTPAPKVVLGLPSGTSEWVVTERGFGPITFDKTAEATEAAMGSYFRVGKDPRGCSVPQFPNGPEGGEPIIDGNQVVGIKVDRGGIETSLHIKVGTPEVAVRRAYMPLGDTVRSSRVDSAFHELMVVPDPRVATYGIVFAIVNGRVASYRAGNVGEMRHRQQC